MAKTKTYHIEVLFTLPVMVTVKAEDLDDAFDKAEVKASEEFRENLDKGLYGVSDFDCDAQTP